MRPIAKGFTLVELLVTVSLVGILAAIAIPNFSSSIQNNKIDTEISDLQRALNYARLEAINRGVTVRIAPVNGTDWATELQVLPASQASAAQPTILRRVPALTTGATLAAANVAAANVEAIEFNNLGGLSTPAANVVMTYTRNSTIKTLSVCLTGRIVLGNC
jgi:type IV fimbrial biogenesis protein FimU